MKISVARLYGALILIAACLHGCGAQPVLSPLVQMAWQDRFGDGYVGYCKAGKGLWLVSSNGLEQFVFERGDRPFSVTRQTTKDWDKVELGSYSMRCQEASFEVKLSRADWAASQVRVGRPKLDATWLAGQSLTNTRITHTIGEAETLVVGSDGWRYQKSTAVLDSRRRMGAIVDSVFDGQFLWALSRDTLWRVDLVHRLIRHVQMPEHGLKPPFNDLFRDGRLLWLSTRTGSAMPYRIDGLRAMAMQAAGQLATNSQLVEVPLRRGELVWGGRGTALSYRQQSSSERLVDKVDAVLYLNSRQVLVASGDTINLWTLKAAKPVLTQTYQQPGPTIDLYMTGKTVIAVGQDYGVLTGRIVVSDN